MEARYVAFVFSDTNVHGHEERTVIAWSGESVFLWLRLTSVAQQVRTLAGQSHNTSDFTPSTLL